jgi:predicted DNA-binding transcriptional regulator YafY
MPLNEVEVNQLKAAFDILAQFRGMPQFEWINETLPKLQNGLRSDQKSLTIIDFDNNQYLKGIENIGILYNAIFYKKVLSICYQPYENENPFEVLIHPYFLKQYNNRWFCFGYNPENSKYDWNLAIDRIVSINETKLVYRENDKIDWQEYFEDLIGVTKPTGSEPEKVVLRFLGKTGKYMETKPINGSQKSRWIDNDILEISLHVIINYELERLILSYADSVVVLQPISLINTIRSRIQASLKQYE